MVEKLQDLLTAFTDAATYLRLQTRPAPILQRSLGLSLAARDLACSLGSIGLLAPVPDGEESRGDIEQAAAYKYCRE